jgi:TPR repeat protein
MEWYRKAATGGLAAAQHNIGLLYNNGYGVAENPIEAVKWFKQASEKELKESEYMLGLAYQSGNGASLDYAEARKLFLSSAKKKLRTRTNDVRVYATGRRGRQIKFIRRLYLGENCRSERPRSGFRCHVDR